MTNKLSKGEWLLLLAIVGVSLFIVLRSSYLPMNDASSHLGTAVIADQLLQGDAFTAAHYRFLPLAVPYWAATLLVTPLIPLFGPLKAFVVFVGLYIVLLPLGFYLLMRTAAPENVRLTAVAALAAFNYAYWLGEVNFMLGQVAVLFSLALFLRIPKSDWRMVVGFMACAVATYTCHIFALTGLLAAVGALTVLSLAAYLFAPLASWRFVRGQWCAVAWLVMLFATGAYFVLFQKGTTSVVARGQPQHGLIFQLGVRKLGRLGVDPFDSPTFASRGPAVVFAGIICLILLLSAWSWIRGATAGKYRIFATVNPPLFVAALAFIALFYLAPAATVREGEIGQRFLLLSFLVGLGAIRFRPDPRLAAALAAAVAVFGVFKLTDAWRLHREYDATVSALSRNVIATVPERSRLVPIEDEVTTRMQKLYHRLGNYVVIERHGYSPNILATPGQQALRHVNTFVPRGAGQRISQRGPDVREMSQADWSYYDYVLVQAPADPPRIDGLQDHTAFVTRWGEFALYKIDHSPAAKAEAR